MVKRIHKSYNRNNSSNTGNPYEMLLKALKSEINKEKTHQHYKEAKRYTPQSKKNFELKKVIMRKRVMANKKHRNRY